MVQCSSVVAVGLAFFTLSSLGAELEVTDGPRCRTLKDVIMLNCWDYRYFDMAKGTMHLHDLSDYAQTGGTMAGEECIGTLNMIAELGEALFRDYKSAQTFAKNVTMTHSAIIDVWYHIKQETGRFCPPFDEKEAEENRLRRETIMRTALPKLKGYFLGCIESTVKELSASKHALDGVTNVCDRLEKKLERIGCTREKCSRLLPCSCKNVCLQFNSEKKKLNKVVHSISKRKFALARRVKRFRKLAAIYDQDWEEDLKRTVASDPFKFDLGSYIPEQTRTLDNSNRDSETVYGISSDEKKVTPDSMLMNGHNGAEIRHSASSAEDRSDSDSDRSLFSGLKDNGQAS